MNKKIYGIFVGLLICSMILAPFVLAKPWNPKNNEKFLDYDVVIGFNYAVIIEAAANPEYVPSEDKPNKIIVTWEEEATSDYTITIEGLGTYTCGTDFAYSGVAVVTAIGEPYTYSAIGIPTGSKEMKFRVDYMYDFSAFPGGIEGTLEMLAITANEGGMRISSQSGTGDLQNVQVFATAGGAGHDGIVIGWPDIPPA